MARRNRSKKPIGGGDDAQISAAHGASTAQYSKKMADGRSQLAKTCAYHATPKTCAKLATAKSKKKKRIAT